MDKLLIGLLCFVIPAAVVRANHTKYADELPAYSRQYVKARLALIKRERR